MGDTCDLCVLLCDAFFCINHNNDHISTFYCRYRTDAVAFQIFFNLILTAESCCINKYIRNTVVDDLRIYCVSSGSCNIGNDHTVFT